VQACGQASGACALTQTNGQGNYSLTGLTTDTDGVSVNPPTDSSLLPAFTWVPVASGADTQADVELYNSASLPFDVIMTYHRLNADGTPVVERHVG